MKKRKIHSPPFSGIPTFAKFPLFPYEPIIKNSFGIIGIPYDMGTTDYPGARLAPRTIREASTQYAYTSSYDNYGLSDSKRGFYNIESNKWTLTNFPCFDLGDVEIVAGDPKTSFEFIQEEISYLIKRTITPISLGGDHGITFPILQAFKNLTDITVLHFDAHMDYWDPSRNSIFDHSCTMWNVAKVNNISHIYQFGIRGLNHKPEMIEKAIKNKVTFFTADKLLEYNLNNFQNIKLSKNIYISFDIDFFDPSIAPGTGMRESGGLQYRSAIQLLNRLLVNKKINLVGADIVEVNPLIDIHNTTSLLAARLILDIIGLFN